MGAASYATIFWKIFSVPFVFINPPVPKGKQYIPSPPTGEGLGEGEEAAGATKGADR